MRRLNLLDCAPAYAGLASAHAVLSGFDVPDRGPDDLSRMREAAERAIQLDPLLAEAHAGLGLVRLSKHAMHSGCSPRPRSPFGDLWRHSAQLGLRPQICGPVRAVRRALLIAPRMCGPGPAGPGKNRGGDENEQRDAGHRLRRRPAQVLGWMGFIVPATTGAGRSKRAHASHLTLDTPGRAQPDVGVRCGSGEPPYN